MIEHALHAIRDGKSQRSAALFTRPSIAAIEHREETPRRMRPPGGNYLPDKDDERRRRNDHMILACATTLMRSDEKSVSEA